jgi:hypothetical protein
MSHVTIHPKRITRMKNSQDVVSGFKHDNRFRCHLGIESHWKFQVGLNVAVDETWVDVTSRHRLVVDLLGAQGTYCMSQGGSPRGLVLTSHQPRKGGKQKIDGHPGIMDGHLGISGPSQTHTH